MPKQRYIEAINTAFFEEMERNDDIIIFGQDVELSIMGDMRGLVDKFGRNRIRNSPICEQTLTGMAVGATAACCHVVLHMMFNNFIYTGFDAIANQMAKLRLMTGGQMELPITVIAGYGGGSSTAAQHSDTAYPALMNLGGINVCVPSNPADAKGLLKTALRTRNPTFFLEASSRGGESGEIPEGDHLVPFGKARIAREGSDVTVVAIGTMMKPALAAAKALEEQGVSAEVLDPRTLVPLDEAAIVASLEKTGRLIVVDEARDRCSAASHIAAIAADKAFAALKAPVRRVTVPDTCMPYAPSGEGGIIPSADDVASAALELVKGEKVRAG